MPIEIHRDDDDSISVQPDTNEARVLAVLVQHPNTAFTKTELAERADVKTTSIYKTVDRLLEKGLVKWHADGRHVHISHEHRDAIYRRLRSFRDTSTFERMFNDDYFAANPGWADGLPDLGKEPLPPRETEAEQGDCEAEQGDCEAKPDDTEAKPDDTEAKLDDIDEMPDLDE